MRMSVTQQDFFSSLRKIIGNGEIVFGFVASADKGLEPNEYIITTRTPGPFQESVAATLLDGDMAGFIRDAERVESFNIPDLLKPFVVAGRMWTTTLGYLGEETQEATENLPGSKHPVPESLQRALELGPQIGTLPIYITTVMYYNTNHNTGGIKLPKGYLKVIKSCLNLKGEVTDEEITRAVYLGGHGADKRLTLRSYGEIAQNLRRPNTFGSAVVGKMDSWAKTRAKLHPAGTHSLGVLSVVLNKICSVGLAGFSPVPAAIDVLSAAIQEYKASPHMFHPGAKYLFGGDPIALHNVEEVKYYIGYFGRFCMELDYCKSIYGSPQYKALAEEHGDLAWQQIGRGLSRSKTISVEAAVSAMRACGNPLAELIPDPKDDPQDYAVAASSLRDKVHSLSLMMDSSDSRRRGPFSIINPPPNDGDWEQEDENGLNMGGGSSSGTKKNKEDEKKKDEKGAGKD